VRLLFSCLIVVQPIHTSRLLFKRASPILHRVIEFVVLSDLVHGVVIALILALALNKDRTLTISQVVDQVLRIHLRVNPVPLALIVVHDHIRALLSLSPTTAGSPLETTPHSLDLGPGDLTPSEG
jgi:hypothetical protein